MLPLNSHTWVSTPSLIDVRVQHNNVHYFVGLYICALAHGIDGVLEPYRQALVSIEDQVVILCYAM